MESHQESSDVKRIKRMIIQYLLNYKLFKIEQGELSTLTSSSKYGLQFPNTVVNWLGEIGNFNWEN